MDRSHKLDRFRVAYLYCYHLLIEVFNLLAESIAIISDEAILSSL